MVHNIANNLYVRTYVCTDLNFNKNTKCPHMCYTTQ